MRLIISSMAAVAAAIAAPALGEPELSKADDEEKLICKRVLPPSGSRLEAKRQCATKREWAQRDEMMAETRRNLDKIQQQRAR